MGFLSFGLLAVNVRKLQVGRAAIDCGEACSGRRVAMRGRECSGRARRGRRDTWFNWTQSASIQPGKEVPLVVARRSVWCTVRLVATFAGSEITASPQDYIPLLFVSLLVTLLYISRTGQFSPRKCTTNKSIYEYYCRSHHAVVPLAKFLCGRNGLMNHRGCKKKIAGKLIQCLPTSITVAPEIYSQFHEG